jgi:flavin-binding protein dodecin
MFRMLEVIGSSETGFSEAVRQAVEGVIQSGAKAHFFEVVEQRGAVRDGKLKEFQVKVKVAVEDMTAQR